MNKNDCVIFFGGLILLQYIVKILKSVLKEKRPIESNTYGMPSTKSATLSYISTFFIIHYKLNNKDILKLIIITAIGILYKLCYKEHTINQILCGIIIGILYAHIINIYI
uniref:Phosphatidic acid phosphatase type 2/haloperoxidase domain-containing protein n=1 Tax=viral metagenome TaxID=1070528 RepID=A0A6C0CYE2_9ZZZZ